MKKDQILAAMRVSGMLKKASKLLKVNRNQNEPRVIFEMLSAIDEAAVLLDKAWKVSTKHNLTDEAMRKEFVRMFAYFGKLKKDINEEMRVKH